MLKIVAMITRFSLARLACGMGFFCMSMNTFRLPRLVLRSALVEVNYTDDGRDAARAEIATRIRMMRADLWPTNPDPEGCRHCDTRVGCPGFDGFTEGGNFNE